MLIEEEDYSTLRDSIDNFDRYDTVLLAKRLEKHALLEFRRLAAHLYKVYHSFPWCPSHVLIALPMQKTSRWETSIGLSKEDKLFKDAIVTAAASNSIDVAEDLLTYFVIIGNRECFAATLYACFDLLRSDVVMDLSWQHGLNDFYMPYRIQNQRMLVDKVTLLSLKLTEYVC